MVNIEDLLNRVQQAERETDRQWILLELQMSQMSEALVSMLWAAAIPHFFDEKVLAALRPELADQAEELYADLQELTFVEEFPGHGYNIHELTREVLLSQLWQHNRAEFLLLSKRAADYFFALGASSEEDVEFCYHEILNEGETQTGRLLNRANDWWTYNQIERVQAALQGFGEHEQAGRLDSFGQGFVLHLNGLIKSHSGNYAEAESFFNRAQAVYEDTELTNPRYITTLLHDFSNSKREQGDYESALDINKQVLRIAEEQLGENHPDTSTSLNNLASLYHDLGRYQEAEPFYLRALKISEGQLGANHPNTATSLNNLASLYHDLGRYQEAEPFYLRALKIREEQLGANHPYTATSLNNLALLYQAQKRYQEAEPLYLRALKIREEQLGANHPDTAASLGNLALLYQAQKRYQEAIPLRERWKRIKQERQETNNLSFAHGVRKLGQLYEKCQQIPQAVANYEEALAIFSQTLGSRHPRTSVLKEK